MRCRMLCVGLLLLAGGRLFAFDWTLIKQDGRDYVPVTDIARFYSFTQADYSGDSVSLSGSTLRMQGSVGSRDLYLNGLKFILNFPMTRVEDKILISRMDLSKLVEPVLRPAKIRTAPVSTIVLDAGHGGFDQGARSLLGNEKDFALDVVLRARALLARAGFTVKLTRAADIYIPLELRAMFASHQSNAVFVSVHFNWGLFPDAAGIETYCLAPRGVPSTNSPVLELIDFQPALGNALDPENIALATAMHGSLITRLGAPDRGIKRARFVVLRDIKIPGVLLEGGFLTNPQDCARVANPTYRQLMAQAIYQGILTYNRAVERGLGSSEIMAQRTRPPNQNRDQASVSIWDPLRSNAYSSPEEIRQ
ncbi:MAG: N-acetylmuramoyl-L-alanine amidase [Chthoniobacterales bacterium]